MNNTKIVHNAPVPINFRPKRIEEESYHMGDGRLQAQALMPTGHGWKQFRPAGETQRRNNIEPNSCPAGGTLNVIETLGTYLFKKTGFQNDLSERYLSIMMGMIGQGGWPWDAAKWTRNAGAVPEAFLPFDTSITTLDKFFSPRPIPYWLFKVGMHWKSVYDFGFDWVFHPGQNLTIADKQARMKEALKFSPLGVAGYAWSLHNDGKYYHDGPDIHWFSVDDFTEGDSWDAFDTYEPYGKKLDWNYDFGYCIRYSLARKPGAENVTFDPNNAEDVKLEYLAYLINYYLKKLV